jgi:hypothetical protein
MYTVSSLPCPVLEMENTFNAPASRDATKAQTMSFFALMIYPSLLHFDRFAMS